MIRESSRFDVPRASSERINRSSETEGSPASIFATRDWLEFSSLASSACEMRRRRRRTRRLAPSRSFRSMYAASSSVSPRNSWALPTRQPFASRRLLFSSRTVVLPEPSPAGFNDSLEGRPGLLAEDLQDHDGIQIKSVHDSPVDADILNPQLVAAWSDGRHGPRVGHAQQFAFLQSPKQIAGLQPGRRGEGRRLDLSMKPDEGFVVLAHDRESMSDRTWSQGRSGGDGGDARPHHDPAQQSPRADGRGLVLALEIMVMTPAIRRLIREQTYQLYSAMQAGTKYGMQTMNQAVAGLVRPGAHHARTGHGLLHAPRGLNPVPGDALQ